MLRPYPQEFREGALALAGRGDRPVVEIAHSSGSPSRVFAGGLPRPRFTGHSGEQSDHAIAAASANRCSRASAGVR